MKAKVILVSLFLSLAFLSCKNEIKKEEVKPAEEVKANTFDVTVDLILKKDDELVLFYKDESITYFVEDMTVWAGLKGSEALQTAKFSIPEGILPNNIRIDISSKKEQEPIVIKSIGFSYEGRSFSVKGEDLEKYFTPNEYIKFNPSTATATLLKIKDAYDPFFLTKETLFPEIERVRGVKL